MEVYDWENMVTSSINERLQLVQGEKHKWRFLLEEHLLPHAPEGWLTAGLGCIPHRISRHEAT